MSYAEDPGGYRERLKAKLQPDVIRSTLAFAGLFQVTHEMLKREVLDKVREYHCLGLNADGSMADAEKVAYRLHVLSLASDRFRASLLWLAQHNAITQAQADRLDSIYAHRHSLTHELVKYIVDPDIGPDIDLLSDAITTLKDLHRFWIDIELNTGGFFPLDGSDVGDVDPDEVLPLSLMVLQQCLDAYVAGIAKA